MLKKLVALFILALFAVACAPALRVHYFGRAGYPPTDPSSVDLLRVEPRRPHVAFAEIRYDPPQRMSRARWSGNCAARERPLAPTP